MFRPFARQILSSVSRRLSKQRRFLQSAKRPRTFESLEGREMLAVFISEVHPTGSSGPYAADWFEVTNTGNSALNITGWKMDDNTNLFANSVALRGLTSIPAGKSAVFFEGNATGTTDATIIANFSTAWFGSATPPAGFLIGAYGGTAVGLSGSGDAVNLYDAAGVLQANVTFGAATAGITFDNTVGLNNAPISTLSVAGVNGAFTAGAETGSPGTRGITVDLSTYVRVGRFDLPEPTRTAAPANNLLAQEASGVAYNWDTDSLFIVGDGGKSVTQVSKTGALIDTMTLALGGSPQGTDFYDIEGITYIGGGQFVMSEERDRQLVLFTYVAGTTLSRSGALTVKIGTFVDNTGTEGLSYDPQTGGYIVVKEITPMGIFQTGVNFPAGTATNGSPTTVNSIDLFNPALANMLDFADAFALSNLPPLNGQPDSGNLLLLSQASARIVEIDRSGNISSTLQIVADLGSPLSAPDQQHEGLTMDRDGILYVVNENGGGDIDHPQLWVYMPSEVPNQAPTAIALNNVITSIVENTTTVTPIKVADIVVTDDGLGANNLTVGGTDAAFFEIIGSGLYIKAGTVLDYETKITYSITVSVDDPTLGGNPDATTSYTLTVTDIVNETPVVPAVFISEVHPSGSGNTSYSADWFEVTNNGSTAVIITGWSVDDNSNGSAKIPLRGLTSIPAGKSAVFFEGLADGSTDAAKIASFSTAWFGSATLPAGFLIGAYGGAGIGLSTGGDAVNLFDAGGNRISGVSFGTTTTGITFDNHAGLGSPALPLPSISTLSIVGTHGAFLAFNGVETGSPGTTGKLVISEVAPWSSGNSPLVGADWFEVTNTGATTVDITGWKVDDNSESFVAAVALNGITSIAAGESVIFIETTDLPGKTVAFLSNWFGASPPANLRIGNYSGSGVGLGTTSDAVNLYESSGVLHAKVFFAASPSSAPFRTFDNAVGLNNAVISQLSSVGVNGAFIAVNGPNEIGSPGTVLADLSATLVGGALTVTDLSFPGKDNNLTAKVIGTNLVITDASQQFISAPPGATLSNANRTLTIPLSLITGAINLNAAGGNDLITLDYSGGPFRKRIVVDGGASGTPGDKLVIKDASTAVPLVVDTRGGKVDASSDPTGGFSGFEFVAVVDPTLSDVLLGNMYVRTTPGADFVQATTAGEVNPSIRLRIGNTYFPLSGGSYGPYITSGAGAGRMNLFGRDGNDTLSMYNTRLNAAFFGEDGNDVITGGYGDDLLVGGAGNDRVNGAAVGGNDEIWGDVYNPAIDDPNVASQTTLGGNDQINTFGGNDAVYGQGGNDLIYTGAGDDYINGGEGNDQVDGQAGNDRIYGGAGNDIVSGSEGNDVIAGNGGNDTLLGRTGNDILIGGLGADTVNGHEGSDALVGDESNGAASGSLSKGDAADAALLALLLNWGPVPSLASLGSFGSSGDDNSVDTLWGGSEADAFFNTALDNPADRNASDL
ncbi:MAG: lamin tail domain-containing protein [Pirellulaceae bacterium]